MNSDSAPLASLSVNTSASLLARVKARDGPAWRNLVNLYGPMVYRWARKAGLQAHDAQDVVQNVFLAVASDISHFQGDRPGSTFRGWLWTICHHKVMDCFRESRRQTEAVGGTTAQQRLQHIAASEPGPNERSSDTHRLRHRALALVHEQFENHAWQAFLRIVLHGDRPTDVARDLGVSVATVYRAKFRILTQLRTELEGL